MGWGFRKSIKIAPGVRLNLSKRGIGASVGVKGARYSVGPRGRQATFSIPKTGISYRTKLQGGKKPKVKKPSLLARIFGR